MPETNEMTGGEALARMLQAHKTGPMFGMGGFQLLPFYDAARRLGLDHNLINDERCAVFAADAYAKVSGRVGVCDATLGPGATNLVTGLVEALNAGSPLVVLVGDTHRAHSWKNMTQETNQTDILKPACKEFLRVEMIERIPEFIRRAFAVATSGRPGPVVVAVPEDICHGTYHFEPEDFAIDACFEAAPSLRMRAARDDMAEAARLIADAKTPLILCGGGVHISGAHAALVEFATTNNIPVAHTLSGKGAIACTHPLSAGLFGRYDRIANALIAQSDCLLVIGCKLGEIATKRYSLPAAGQTLIHMEIVAEEFDRTFRPALRLWSDAREGLIDLHQAVQDIAPQLGAGNAAYAGSVPTAMATWRDSVSARMNSSDQPIDMARVLLELNKTLPAEAILVADGGFAAHWAGLLYDTKQAGRGFVPDRGFASIGYGLPGAMGAKLAAPDRPVISITGDGGFNMVLGELETAKRMGLAFTLLIVNNAASGYVKALQHLMYGEGNYQSSDLNEQNYARLAEVFGCQGIRVEDPDQLSDALKTAMATTDRPTVLDLVVTRDAAKMLPGVDSRTAVVKKGDRVA
ncbi:MAG: thiamine pyrophosphate-binding protein [Rhodospirillales bacterium]|nr:thiamine pyrophosphate-binding protein [Rhodospirillales bacterium]